MRIIHSSVIRARQQRQIGTLYFPDCFWRLMLLFFLDLTDRFCRRGRAEKKLCSPFLRETVCEMRGPMRGRGRGRGMGPGMWGPPRGMCTCVTEKFIYCIHLTALHTAAQPFAAVTCIMHSDSTES